jgi:hypothetical protein
LTRLWQGFGLLLVVVTGTLSPARPAFALARDPRLSHVRTWAFAIGNRDLRGDIARRYAAYDLLVLDGQEASRRQVATLRRAGKIVLAYLDVGTIEPWRPWYGTLKAYRLDRWARWGEWYARVSAAGFRRAIVERIAPEILGKGFDGLFLDNTDMIESHPTQTRGMRRLARGLARLVHGRRKLLFTQNGEGSLGPTLRLYDGWNREDVSSTFDASKHRYVRQPPSEVARATRALRRIGAAGLLTLATDYTAPGDTATARAATRTACGAGALPFRSDIALTRVPAQPARCP